eukprot:1436559-Rhodomonas_salina.1
MRKSQIPRIIAPRYRTQNSIQIETSQNSVHLRNSTKAEMHAAVQTVRSGLLAEEISPSIGMQRLAAALGVGAAGVGAYAMSNREFSRKNTLCHRRVVLFRGAIAGDPRCWSLMPAPLRDCSGLFPLRTEEAHHHDPLRPAWRWFSPPRSSPSPLPARMITLTLPFSAQFRPAEGSCPSFRPSPGTNNAHTTFTNPSS